MIRWNSSTKILRMIIIEVEDAREKREKMKQYEQMKEEESIKNVR